MNMLEHMAQLDLRLPVPSEFRCGIEIGDALAKGRLIEFNGLFHMQPLSARSRPKSQNGEIYAGLTKHTPREHEVQSDLPSISWTPD
jgi:hypothetical protein